MTSEYFTLTVELANHERQSSKKRKNRVYEVDEYYFESKEKACKYAWWLLCDNIRKIITNEFAMNIELFEGGFSKYIKVYSISEGKDASTESSERYFCPVIDIICSVDDINRFCKRFTRICKRYKQETPQFHRFKIFDEEGRIEKRMITKEPDVQVYDAGYTDSLECPPENADFIPIFELGDQ